MESQADSDEVSYRRCIAIRPTLSGKPNLRHNPSLPTDSHVRRFHFGLFLYGAPSGDSSHFQARRRETQG